MLNGAIRRNTGILNNPEIIFQKGKDMEYFSTATRKVHGLEKRKARGIHDVVSKLAAQDDKRGVIGRSVNRGSNQISVTFNNERTIYTINTVYSCDKFFNRGHDYSLLPEQ